MSAILKSIQGHLLGLGHGGELIATNGARLGSQGRQIVLPSERHAAVFSDFAGAAAAYSTTVADGLLARKGSDGACVDFTVTAAKGGTIAGVVGNTTASMAVSGVQLFGGLHWYANAGELYMAAKIKLSKITNIAAFIGFTDQVAALEMPIHSAASADTITTNATDGVGFMFDTSMSTDNWWAVGVANDVDATAQNLAVAPVADTYETLAVYVNASGVATFFRNGRPIGSAMTGAVTPTVALVPTLAAFNRTTSGNGTLTADWWSIASLRAA